MTESHVKTARTWLKAQGLIEHVGEVPSRFPGKPTKLWRIVGESVNDDDAGSA